MADESAQTCEEGSLGGRNAEAAVETESGATVVRGKGRLLAIAALLVVAIAAIAIVWVAPGLMGPSASDGYTHLTAEEAADFVENASANSACIVDVRGEVAYEMGHIPGAIATWYEDYEGGRLDVLPDLDQQILVYCDEGVLSKRVAQQLVGQGYTNVYEFDGMKVWEGEIVVDEKYQGVVGL